MARVWNKPPKLETRNTLYVNVNTVRTWNRSDHYIINTPIRLYRMLGTEQYFAVDAFHNNPPQEVEDKDAPGACKLETMAATPSYEQ